MTITVNNKDTYPITIDRAYGTTSISIDMDGQRISTGSHLNETAAWKALHALMNNACFKINY